MTTIEAATGNIVQPGLADAPASAASGGDHGTIPSIFERIPVTVQIVLGHARMSAFELARLEEGAVVPLDRRLGDCVEIFVNNVRIGRGQIEVSDDKDARFSIVISDLGEGEFPAGR